MKRWGSALAWVLLVTAPAVARAELDVSEPMLCALTEAIECGHGSACTSGSVEEVNLPPFIVVDAKAKTLREHDGTRTSSVTTVEDRDGQLLLRGYEQRAYQVSISPETGRLTASAVAPDAGFVLFGVCTNR